jgi:hypothetical protein
MLVPSNVLTGRFSPPELLQDNEDGENPFGQCPSIEQHVHLIFSRDLFLI